MMKIPKVLTGHAREFAKANWHMMIEDGRLSDATYHSFLLMCRTWSSWMKAIESGADEIKEVALGKQVQNMFAQWGMTPASRKRLKLDERKIDISKIMSDMMKDEDAI